MSFTHALSTNNYGPRKLIVATSPANGTHITLATAMAAASSGDTIELRDSVTENVTITPGVNITGPGAPGSLNMPTITGTLTMSGAGTSTVANVILKTNSAPIVTVSGSVASQLFIRDCYLDITNNTAISYTSSSGSSFIEMLYCQGNFSSGTGIALYTMTSSGRLNIRHCSIRNDAGTATASDASAGIAQLFTSNFTIPFSTSSTGAMNIQCGVNIDSSATNTIALLMNGTGGGRCECSAITSGSAASVSIGAGNTFTLSDVSISSTNTNPVTGAGTLVSGLISFRNSGNTINTTTRTGRFSDLTAYTAPSQPAFSAYLGTQDSNVTGDGTTYTLGSGNALTEIFDVGNNFNNATGTFTAPVTGKYKLTMQITALGLLVANSSCSMQIVTSNRNYFGSFFNWQTVTSPGATQQVMTILADMDAADTATATFVSSNGTKVVDIQSAADSRSSFQGVLMC